MWDVAEKALTRFPSVLVSSGASQSPDHDLLVGLD